MDRVEAAEFVGIGQTTLEKLVRKDEFPKPRMLSNKRVAWLVRELEAWAESRPVSTMLPPPNTGHSNRVRSSGPTSQGERPAS